VKLPVEVPISRSSRAAGPQLFARPLMLSIGGTCGIVGAPALGTEASFDVNGVMTAGKRIIGIIEGESKPDLFIPALAELYMQGRFPFDKLVKFYMLDQINQAAEDSEKGVTIKPVIRFVTTAA
jgi:aryl-alcohol dehydrogenase